MSKTIKAVLIDPYAKTITDIEVAQSFTGENGMYKALHCEMIQGIDVWKYKIPGVLPQTHEFLLNEEGEYSESIGFFIGSEFYIWGRALVVGVNVLSEYYLDSKLTAADFANIIHWETEVNDEDENDN